MSNTSPAGNTGSQIPQAEKYLLARSIDVAAPGYLSRSYETWKQLDPAQITAFRHFPAVQAIFLMQL